VKNEIYWHEGDYATKSYRITQSLTKTNLRIPGDLTAEVAQPQNAGNLISGNTVRVPIRVTNTGKNAISGRMDIQVFVQGNQAIQPGDAPVMVLQNQKVALKPGQTATYYANVQLPLGVAGDFHCIAKIDSANTILELNEANNIAATPNTMNVQLGFVDLTGRLNRVTLPTAVVAGQRLRGSVAVEVVNQGNVPLGPKVLVNVALFARNTDTGELVALGQLQGRNVGKLAPNGSRIMSFAVPVNLPNGLPKGDYELCAQITPTAPLTESNLGNNLVTQQSGGLGAVAVTSSDPFVDLVAGVDNRLAARYPLPNRVASGSGARLYVPVTITNRGNVLTDRRQYIDVSIYAQDANGVRVLVATLQRQNVGNLARRPFSA
jgi:archaellum component FlaG (FlaF/FlaG flagellin family)